MAGEVQASHPLAMGGIVRRHCPCLDAKLARDGAEFRSLFEFE